jgi:hypothetical protein
VTLVAILIAAAAEEGLFKSFVDNLRFYAKFVSVIAHLVALSRIYRGLRGVPATNR